jgi:methyl-accepting chemotaxis protein
MRFLDNIKMGPKLIASFLITAALAIVVGLFAISKLQGSNDNASAMHEKGASPLADWATISQSTMRIRGNVRDILLGADADAYAERISARKAERSKAEESFEKDLVSDEAKELWRRYKENQAQVAVANDKILSMNRSGRKAEALALLYGETERLAQEQNKIYGDMARLKAKLVEQLSSKNEADFNAAKKAMYFMMALAAALGAALGIIISRSIAQPMAKGVEMMQEMAKGHLGLRLKMDRGDEIGDLARAMDGFTDNLQTIVVGLQEIAKGDLGRDWVAADAQDEINPALKQVRTNLQALVTEAAMLNQAAVEGKLATRADATKHQGEYRKIVQGVNDTLDAVIGPLNVAAGYVDRISKGDIPPKITDKYNGDFNEIKNNLNQCVDAVNALVADANMLSEAAIVGKLNTRAEAAKHQGDYRKIIQGVNDTIDSLVNLLDNMPAPAMVISKDFEVLYMNKAGAALGNTTGEQLVRNKQRCYDFFRTGDCRTDKCACALAMRNNSQNTSETDARPGNHSLDIQYTGVPIRDRSGQVIGAFEVVTDQTAVKKAARLSDKIASYQQVEIARVNANLNKVATGNLELDLSLADADSDTQETRALFATISDALGRSAAAINLLVADAGMLATAGVEGKLNTRAEAAKHQGDYRKIIQGVNDTLDAVIGPLNVAAAYVDRIGKGEVPPKITDNYNGDFNTIKNNINSCIDGLQGLVEANTVIQKMAANDFTTQVVGKYQGVFEELGKAINDTISQIRDALVQVQEGALAIASASGEISMGNTDLSGRTEEQAANLEEVASSMEQITSNVNQTADNARSANQEANKARQVAQDGGAAVTQVIAAMEAINQSSAKINEIIGVVDEIAFQTNLLALNAAVEAARAGEQGRGFAVVATEVRNLAKRSADAAKEIKVLIRESVAKSVDGNKVAAHAGETIAEVVANVQRVTALVSEIAGATQEQSTGLNEINKAVVQMDEVTQQNAALVEEAAAAAESLDTQAHALSEVVGRFKTGAETRQAHVGHATAVRGKTSTIPAVHPSLASNKGKGPQISQRRSSTRGELASSKPPVATPKSDDDGQWEAF